MKTFTPSILLLFLIFIPAVYAQQKSPVLSVRVEYKPVPGSNLFRTELKITLLPNSTGDLRSIHLRIGSQRNADDYYSRIFVFNETGTQSDGSVYSRNNNILTLSLPPTEKHERFFGDVVIERTDESLSNPITFNR